MAGYRPHGIHLTGGVTYVGNAWGAGDARATIRAIENLDTGIVRFRDHPTIATEVEGFDLDANSMVATGIDINHAYWSLMNGATKRAKDCIVRRVRSRTSRGEYKYGIIVSNHGGSGGYAENVEILDCTVYDVSRDAICLYPGDGNADCRIHNITVRGCEVFDTGQDPDYGAGAGIIIKGHVVNATIERNFVHDTKGALIFVNGNENRHFNVGPTNIHIRYNIVTGSTGHGGIRLYDGSSGKDPKDVKIYGNIVFNTPGGGLYLGNDLGNNLSLLVYNNLFLDAPVLVQNNNANILVFEFRNNLLVRSTGVPLTDSARKITAHSNNLYYRSSGTLVSAGGTSYSAGNLSSYESTARSANPLFVNISDIPTGFISTGDGGLAPNTTGLSLHPSSPALGAGVALADDYSNSVNSVARLPSSWDIGPYQAQGPAVTSPPAPSGLSIEAGN